MPHWICDSCGTRLYSASEQLKWPDCPVCAGKLGPEHDDRARVKHETGGELEAPRGGSVA